MAGKNIAGIEYPLVMLVDTAGVPTNPTGGGGSGGLTNAELRASPVPVTLSAATTATETYTTHTGAFTIAAGALAYSVINTGAAAFTFGGQTIPTQVLSVSGQPLQGKTYPALSGDATGTTVIVQRTA